MSSLWGLVVFICLYFTQVAFAYSTLKLHKVVNRRINRTRYQILPRQAIGNILTPEEFEIITTKSTSKVPCVIDFQKSECKPCKKIAPDYEALSVKYEGIVNFYKIDADTSKEALSLMKANGIRSVPTFHVWIGGIKVDTVLGAHLDEVEDTLILELKKQA
jgi:thioredoxin 1